MCAASLGVVPLSFASATSLGTLAAEKGLRLGASFSTGELDQAHGPSYARLYREHVHHITSELELKLAVLAPRPGARDFGPADRLFEYAERNGLAVRGHTLIWNDDIPDWVRALTKREVIQLLDGHIAAVMARYRGRVSSWDVVNEPIAPWDRQPGNLRNGPFLSALGVDYIARSFHVARAADATAELVLNEAQTESADENGQVFRDSLMGLLRDLKADGAPIDAIGLQAHLDSARPYDFPRFAGFIEEIAALDYKVLITELDVNDRAFANDIRERDAKVAEMYSAFLRSVLSVRAVTSVTFWQLADHTSWITYQARKAAPAALRRPRPLPFDENFAPKRAFYAIVEALTAMPPRS